MRILKLINQGQISAGLFAVIAFLCMISSPTRSEDRRYKVEAAYLYSFFNYITWPGFSSPQELKEPSVCIYGDDPILPYLHYVSDKMNMERNLIIRTITQKEEVSGCHIFFVRNFISARWLVESPEYTLTVVEPNDPLDRGGMIELVKDDEGIAIKINQGQLENNGFAVSSRLLNLAK